jgi:hypothetical protein
MWAIDNRTPFKVDRAWGRGREGTHEWIVAVKASYAIAPDGALSLADEQPDVLLAAQYIDAPGRSSLRYDADVVGEKPGTDVTVVGTAYAPGGQPSTDFPIGLVAGPLRKRLRVRGDRHWGEGLLAGTKSPALAIASVPVVYERAYGGYDAPGTDPAQHRLDPRNPVGVGVVAKGTRRNGQSLPNFEYPGQDVERAGPAGLGPIDAHWSPRLEMHGTYDGTWRRERFPLLPQDWSPLSRHSAPPDQRTAEPLRGGEQVALENLTPSGQLNFVLPRVHLRFRTLLDGSLIEHAGQLSAVIIEPDHPRVSMVWQASLPVHGDVDYLEHTIVSEKVRAW